MKTSQFKNELQIIRDKFKNGPPNGYNLAWNENRFWDELKKAVNPHKVINTTSFDYSFCNSYEIEINSAFSIASRRLIIHISFIMDVYEVYWTQQAFLKEPQVVKSHQNKKDFHIENQIHQLLGSHNFVEVSDALYDTKLTDIKLELSEPENITVGKCLFNDHY